MHIRIVLNRFERSGSRKLKWGKEQKRGPYKHLVQQDLVQLHSQLHLRGACYREMHLSCSRSRPRACIRLRARLHASSFYAPLDDNDEKLYNNNNNRTDGIINDQLRIMIQELNQ